MSPEPHTEVLKAGAELDRTQVITRPGDTLVIAFARALSTQQVDEIRQRLKDELVGVRIIVLDQVSAMTTYVPEDTHG